MSRLSPTTVQRVKTAFSPLYTSGDLSATAHKDSNKLMVDSQGSSAAAGLVATTGGATQDVVKLQEALVTRESQLETQAGQLADLDAALRSLQVLYTSSPASACCSLLFLVASLFPRPSRAGVWQQTSSCFSNMLL